MYVCKHVNCKRHCCVKKIQKKMEKACFFTFLYSKTSNELKSTKLFVYTSVSRLGSRILPRTLTQRGVALKINVGLDPLVMQALLLRFAAAMGQKKSYENRQEAPMLSVLTSFLKFQVFRSESPLKNCIPHDSCCCLLFES